MLFGKKKESNPEIYTEDTCLSCSEITKRRHEEEDYVYGEGVQCRKCMSFNTMVTAIYGEYSEEDR